jgi:xyloglucan-specific exo-beta-1,4-glucanase
MWGCVNATKSDSGGPTRWVFMNDGLEETVPLALISQRVGAASFIKLEHLRHADSLGFGKAAPGKDYPALFLAGKINGLHALFRSDDAGANQVRTNDDQHLYGSISRATGDPRAFGRVYFATSGRGAIYGDINHGPTSGKND